MNLLQQLSQVFFDIVAMITRLAPLAALGAMAYTVGTYGVHTLVALSQLLLAMLLTCLLFIFGVLALIARAYGFRLWRLLRHIREELFIAGSTSSSETALPGLMEKMEAAGCPRPVVGLVVPAGYSLQPGRHEHLPDHGCALCRPGHQHPAAALGPATASSASSSSCRRAQPV